MFSFLFFSGEKLLGSAKGKAGTSLGGCGLFGGPTGEAMVSRPRLAVEVVYRCDGDDVGGEIDAEVEVDRRLLDKECKARRTVSSIKRRSERKKLTILVPVVEVGDSGERTDETAILGRGDKKGRLVEETASTSGPRRQPLLHSTVTTFSDVKHRAGQPISWAWRAKTQSQGEVRTSLSPGQFSFLSCSLANAATRRGNRK